jgi:hypothetical protein
MARGAKSRNGAKQVAELASAILNPVLERRAGMTLDLLTLWEDFAGAENAALSRPEKLDWPRRASEDEAFEPATLVVACEGSRAVFLTHQSDTILARVNGYFGFRAVARMRIVQRPVRNMQPPPKPAKPSLKPVTGNAKQILDSVEDDDLRAALERLGTGVFSRRSGQGDQD